MKIIFKLFFSLLVFFPMMQLTVMAAEASDPFMDSEEQVVYRFEEHLFNAETVAYPKGKSEVEGIWKEDRFIFQTLGPEAHIKIVTETIDGEPQQAISFNPVEKVRRKLLFKEVTPGSTLVMYYKIARSEKANKNQYVFLRVKAGQKLLKSMRLFTDEEGWKKEVFSLGIVPFLNHEIEVSFEVSSDLADGVQFSFFAEVQN
jgi:hypothetical protein